MLYNTLHLLPKVIVGEAHPEHDRRRPGSWDSGATDASAER